MDSAGKLNYERSFYSRYISKWLSHAHLLNSHVIKIRSRMKQEKVVVSNPVYIVYRIYDCYVSS